MTGVEQLQALEAQAGAVHGVLGVVAVGFDELLAPRPHLAGRRHRCATREVAWPVTAM